MGYGSKGKGSCVPNRSNTQPKNLPGYQCMSTKRPPANTSSGGMSRSHGTNTGNPTQGMSNPSGRIGASSKRFGSGIPSNTSGPKKLS